MKHKRRYMLSAMAALLFCCVNAEASPEFAEATGQVCTTCHLDPDGGELSQTGLAFAASGYTWPPRGGYRVLGPIRKTARLIVGYLHVVGAFMWFGTILYVHILLRPAYAAKGLPRGEVALGLISMTVVGVTGALLTVSKIESVGVLFRSPWGILLSVKIFLYLFMVSSAVFVVLFVGPKLRAGRRNATAPADGVYDPSTLAAFDGKEGRPARVAVGGEVYDVSSSSLWQGGSHMNHLAGSDLTDAISRAPHGREKLEQFSVKGSFDASRAAPKTGPQKTFYVVAYMNLAMVFVVLGVIAFWRWGI